MLSVVYPRDILFLVTLRKDRPYQRTISCAYAQTHICICYIHCYFFLIRIVDLKNILFNQ
nr:MAG TPA: hypothetical protein [Bacteriophage sp.]